MIIVSIVLLVLLIAAVQYARGVDLDNAALTADNLRLTEERTMLRERVAEATSANERLRAEREALAQEVKDAQLGESIAIAQRDEALGTIITKDRIIAELEERLRNMGEHALRLKLRSSGSDHSYSDALVPSKYEATEEPDES